MQGPTVGPVRLRFFGGLELEGPDGAPVTVRGRGQQSLLLRLAVDAGTTVGNRALIEDLWPDDEPDDPRAALQSLVSRLRHALPSGVLQAVPGGYRLQVARESVDLTKFQDLVAAARRGGEAQRSAALARQALELWTGDPWTPGEGFEWLVRDLLEDHGAARRLAREAAPAAVQAPAPVPAALTALIGRRRELDLIGEQLDAERLVTLIGPGGAGKTTLALETARQRPGALVVQLAPAAAGEVWSVVAAAVDRGIRYETGPVGLSPRERVLTALAGHLVLMVLDNCEHVSAEAAELAVDLLGALPGLRLLATSREPLGVPGEAFVDLGPLPDEDAIEMFRRRVRAARGATPSAADADVVARIVRRLDGLPLALELAAARARTLTLGEIDSGLDDRFALLASGPRTADPRHQTLWALIDWSWETLGEQDRAALLALCVFPDGVGVADAAVVAAQLGVEASAFDLLVDRSLLRRSEGRLRMLETVREYGLTRLRDAGRRPDVLARAARAVTELATSADELLRGPRCREALAWFDANAENVTAALRMVVELGAMRDTGVALLRATLWAWMMRERLNDLRGALTEFVPDPLTPAAPLDSEAEVVVQGAALMVWAFVHFDQPRAESERVADALSARVAQLVAAAPQHPSEVSLALPPLLLGVAEQLGQPEGPTRVWGFRLAVARVAPDLPAWTEALLALLRTAFAQNAGDVPLLGTESERALRLFRAVDDPWGIAVASQLRSEWLMLQGRLTEALAVADASTQALVGLTSTSDLIQEISQAIRLLVRLGRLEEARERVVQVRALADADGSERALLQADFAAASVFLAMGEGEAALRSVERFRQGAPPGTPDQLLAWAGATLAHALLLCGRPDEALGALRAAMPAAVRAGDQPILADLLLAQASWLHATGRADDARRTLAASVRVRGTADATDPVYSRLITDLGTPAKLEGEDDLSAVLALLA